MYDDHFLKKIRVESLLCGLRQNNKSQQAAKSVVKYCTLRDIDPKRLTYKGYGESQPKEACICESCTEEQHQTNRRTVFKVIK